MISKMVYMCGFRGGGQGGPDPPEKHESIGFLSNTGPDPLKNQASIRCWAIISPPANAIYFLR